MHSHVARCEWNKDKCKSVYSAFALFKQAHRERRQLLLTDYFNIIRDKVLRDDAMKVYARETKDFGMQDKEKEEVKESQKKGGGEDDNVNGDIDEGM